VVWEMKEHVPVDCVQGNSWAFLSGEAYFRAVEHARPFGIHNVGKLQFLCIAVRHSS
jgi:hypothetical protein